MRLCLRGLLPRACRHSLRLSHDHPGAIRQRAMRLPSLSAAEVGFRMIAPLNMKTFWGDQSGLNRQPPGSHPGALPIELWPHQNALENMWCSGTDSDCESSSERGYISQPQALGRRVRNGLKPRGAPGQNRTVDLFLTKELHYHCATGALNWCRNGYRTLPSSFSNWRSHLLSYLGVNWKIFAVS